jgi:hypothetical protein
MLPLLERGSAQAARGPSEDLKVRLVWNELSNDGTWFSLLRPRSVDDEAAKFTVGNDAASIDTT